MSTKYEINAFKPSAVKRPQILSTDNRQSSKRYDLINYLLQEKQFESIERYKTRVALGVLGYVHTIPGLLWDLKSP